jgi:hypothetical protein
MNMFGAFLKFKIDHKLNCNLIVIVERCRLLLRITNIIQKMSKPYCLFSSKTCCNVYLFHRGTNCARLLLVNLANWTFVNEHNAIISRFVISKIFNKINIRVNLGTIFTTITKRKGYCFQRYLSMH